MSDFEFCLERQQKLIQHLNDKQFAFAIFTSPQAIFYYSGALVNSQWPQALVISADQATTLISGKSPDDCAASQVLTYTGYAVDRLFDRVTMQEELNRLVLDSIPARKGTAAVEFESIPGGLLSALSIPVVNITPWLLEVRRAKYPDEIERIKATIALAETAYGAIRSQLEPGMREFHAYQIIHEAMVNLAQTSVELDGDFGCGLRARDGGPPSSYKLKAGDLCIFDLFPRFQGYRCDLCRTFCVGEPSSEQLEVWKHVLDAHTIAYRLIRPGLRASDAYFAIRKHLDELPGTRGSFYHHAGHGVGPEGWEHPWLNAAGDQVFVKGEVIACEPGLYADHMGGGIRLEHDYLVTDDAPVALDRFPMDL